MDGYKAGSSKGKSYFTWDTEMDKVLGTCLIEQLNQGNRVEGRNAWKPTAWNAAISSINMHCGKVVTKQNVHSRLMTWNKHFELLSPLVLKSGAPFSWDYSRNRIQIHDESVWQDQLKANPKILPYRKKIEIENWDDICVIFSQDRAHGEGKTVASEEFDNPEVEIEIVGEPEDPETGSPMANMRRTAIGLEGKSFDSTSSSSHGTTRDSNVNTINVDMDGNKRESSKGKVYFTWDTKMDKILGTCLIDQLNKGNKVEGRNAWKPAAWIAAINSLHKHCGIVVTKQNVVARLKTWNKHFDLLSPLLLKSSTSFSWDYLRNRILVHEESAWQDHLKANPKIAPYRKKIEIENWDDICVIFSQDRVNDGGDKSVSEESANPEAGECGNPKTDIAMSKKRRRTIGLKGKSFDSTSSSSREIDAATTNLRRKTIGLERRSFDSASSSSHDTIRKFTETQLPQRATVKEVLHELNKYPELDVLQTLRGIDFLRADPVMFETLCELPKELKRQWLMMHLNR